MPVSIAQDLATVLPVLYLPSGATSHLLCAVVKNRLRVQGSGEPSYLFAYLNGFIFSEWSNYKKSGISPNTANAYANRQGWMTDQPLVYPTYSESKPDWGEVDLIGCFAPALPQAAHASICSMCIVIRSSWCRTDRPCSQILIPTDEVSAVPDCSLGSPGHGWGGCGWSLLTWHCTLRPRETLCSLVWDIRAAMLQQMRKRLPG